MNRTKTFPMLLLLLAATLVLSACGITDRFASGEVKPELVGTWLWNSYTRWTYVLNDDGTGIRGTAEENEAITWSVAGETLRINRQGDVPSGEISNERWTLDLSGDYFTIDSQQVTREMSFTRGGVLGDVSADIVGTWAWEDGIQWTYVFEADGTGTRGWPGEMETFYWGAVDGVLRMEFTGQMQVGTFQNEWWAYTINDGIIRLESRHALGGEMAYYYILGAGISPVYEGLVGLWAWEDNNAWRYVFEPDGTGNRGADNEYETFVWGVSGTTLEILPWGAPLEAWEFAMTADELRLESRLHGVIFYYIRGE